MRTTRNTIGAGRVVHGAMTLAIAAAVAVGALAACSDDGGTGELMGAPGGGNGAAGGAQGASQGGVVGGGGPGGGSSDGGAPAGPSKAQQMFTALEPGFEMACGGACHVQGAGGAPAFLAPPDAYKSVTAHAGIVVKDVPTSILLNKGRHEGPDLVDPLRTQVEAWLEEESKVLTSVALPTTDPFDVTIGANTVDISKGGMGVAGATLTFTANIANDVLTMSNMKVVAPATAAVHVVYPIFVVIPAIGSEKPDNSFSNADQTVGAGQTATLNPGLLILTGWSAGSKLRIEFTKLEPGVTMSDAGAGGGGGACKSLASFEANAKPAIQANNCLSCHNTGGSGNGALDLSGLANNNDMGACAQAKTRINTTTPAQSDIILAPTGGVAAHPFKNASANYASMMQAWIVNEK